MTDIQTIAGYRESRELTLEAFGKLLKPPVNKSTVLRWESGKPSRERVFEVSQITGIPMSSLRPDWFPEIHQSEVA